SPTQAGLMARIVSPNNQPALYTAPSAHHYRLIGLEITMAAGVPTNYVLVQLDGGVTAALSDVPHDLVIDRCYLHGQPTAESFRAVLLNRAATAVIDSYLYEIHSPNGDAQAILGWNGPGPFKIANNHLEGSGENVMFGGAIGSITNLVPSDIEMRGNYFTKPLTWRIGDPSYAGTPWSVKNLLEFKNGQRALIEGNVFENNWPQAQGGHFMVITPRTEGGQMPWAFTGDITFRSNLVRHVTNGFGISGTDSPPFLHPHTARIAIVNNLFEDMGAYWVPGAHQGDFLGIGNQ